MDCFCTVDSHMLAEDALTTVTHEKKVSFRKLKSQDSVTYVSSGSLSTLDQESITFTNSSSELSLPKAGRASPSTTCRQRKFSTAIAKSVDSKHPLLRGRTAILSSTEPTLQLESQQHTNSQLLGQPPKKVSFSQFRNEPAPFLRTDAWSEPKASSFRVRGKNYMLDNKKVFSEESAFQLLGVDMVQSEGTITEGLCGHPIERVQLALKRENETGIPQLPPFLFAVNLSIPGNQTYHLISYYGIDDMDEIKQEKTPFGKLMNKFIFGDSDEFRDETFKLIPRIVEGNYIVRSAVGSKPSLIGKKIKQHYILEERYFEIVVDISSDTVAQKIVKLALGFATALITDIVYVLEGKDEETLPERIFGGLQLRKIDLEQKDGRRKVRRRW